MTLNPSLKKINAAANSLLSPQDQIMSDYDINVTLDAADVAAAIAVGYPIGYNKSTENHGKWVAPDPTVLVIYLGTTKATGGTWGITVNGNAVEVDIAYDATAAEVVAALKGMRYAVTCVVSQTTAAADTFTVTFDGQPEIETLPTVVGTVADLTGDTASTSTTTAGTATNGLDKIRGFVNPNVVNVGTKTGTAALVVLTGSDTVCTGTSVNHGLATGMALVVSGATEAKLNITTTDLVVTGPDTFTYTVAAVSGGTVDSGAYTTTNDEMAVIMVKGIIHQDLPASLVATADVTALDTALKDGLVEQGIIVQGLPGRF